MAEVACRRLAHEERARHVGAIAIDPGPEVEEEHLPGADGAPSRRAMRQGGARPAQAGHVEGEALRAARAHAPLEREGEVVLGRPRAGCPPEVARRASSATAHAERDALELGGLLDGALGFHETLDRYELDVGVRRREGQPRRMAEVLRLDADAAHAPVRRGDASQAAHELRPCRHAARRRGRPTRLSGHSSRAWSR